MADELEALFGRRPAGAWLAERVWEPDLPTSLVAAGYGWTILDDAHFRAAAIPRRSCGARTRPRTRARLLRVFGTEQGLRYRIPFREVDEVIDYLREHATEDGERVGMMGDDGEKFGAWPTTWEHCWGKRRWVERFFEALEANADWLTTTPPERLAGRPSADRSRLRPDRLVRRDGRVGAPGRREPRLRRRAPRRDAGSAPRRAGCAARSWRNFQVKYREINDLHKQMLRVSAKVEAMARARRGRGARPPLPGPVERLLLARPVRRHLHRPHAAGDPRAPDRRRGPRGHDRWHARMPPVCAISTSTAATRSGWRARARS